MERGTGQERKASPRTVLLVQVVGCCRQAGGDTGSPCFAITGTKAVRPGCRPPGPWQDSAASVSVNPCEPGIRCRAGMAERSTLGLCGARQGLRASFPSRHRQPPHAPVEREAGRFRPGVLAAPGSHPLSPDAGRLPFNAAGGGPGTSRNRLWRRDERQLADELGLAVPAAHFPPATGWWNRSERRAFFRIMRGWGDRPHVSDQATVTLIAATTAGAGLTMPHDDDNGCPLGVKVADDRMDGLASRRGPFRGEWSCTPSPPTYRAIQSGAAPGSFAMPSPTSTRADQQFRVHPRVCPRSTPGS